MNIPLKYIIGMAFSGMALQACEESTYTPKPRGFPKIEYPEKAYKPFDKNYCAFDFEYPKYAEIVKDSMFFDEKAKDDCWFDIYVKQFNARIHCSYYPIEGKNTLEKLHNDAFTLAGKHNIKADYIDEIKIQKPNHVSGFLFNIEGAAASPFQFYLTDSSKHFLRGSLYFRAEARPDSLQPVAEFMKQDVMHLINTFEWHK